LETFEEDMVRERKRKGTDDNNNNNNNNPFDNNALAFEVAQMLRDRTTSEEGLTLDEITTTLFGNVSRKLRDLTRKAIKRVRKLHPDGLELLLYGDYISDPVRARTVFRYFNVVRMDDAQPILRRLGLVRDGIERTMGHIVDTVSTPWSKRIKEVNEILDRHQDDINRRRDAMDKDKDRK
jgi:hypothetical protein